MKPISKILWAIDPYDEPSRFQVPLRMLKYLVEATHATIQPVFVVLATGDRSDSDLILEREQTSNLFKEIYLKGLLPPQVVQTTFNDPDEVVTRLLAYGANTNADLVLANTHGWTGLSRVFRGSFVNRLLFQSTIPVMAVGPDVNEINPFDRILYATHLDSISKQDFREAVEIAKLFHSELTVLHLLSRRQRDQGDQEGEDSTELGQSLPIRSKLMRRSLSWSNWASRQGVATEVVLEDLSTQVTKQIRQAASRHRVGLILLESRSGLLASFLRGSKVREIVQSAECPVWVHRLPKKGVLQDSLLQPVKTVA